MAISDYNSLKTSISKWLHRTDLTPMLDDFVMLAEKRVNRLLRLRAMESIDLITMTQGSRFVELPNSFLEPISLTIIYATSQTRLLPISVSKLSELVKNVQGVPQYYAIGDQIEFDVQANDAWQLSLHYLKAFDLSSVGSGTNWLLDHAPEIYLYATLREAFAFINDDVSMVKYEQLLQQHIKDLSEQDGRSRTISKLTTDIGGGRQFNIVRGY